jgi:cobalt-zinc-cadmium efflux system membrane fusion protein
VTKRRSLSCRAGRYACVILLAAASCSAWAQSAAQVEAQPAQIIKISPEQARQTGISIQRIGSGAAPAQGSFRLQGTAVLPNQAIEVVSAPLAGTVQTLLVNPMQAVRAGQPIARIHSPQLLEWQRDYVQAQAQAELAASKLRRDELLYKDGLVSESRLQDTRNASMVAGVAARERRQAMRLAGVGDPALRQLASSGQLSPELTIVARRAGTVTEQMTSPGQRVEMGAALLKLADTRVIWIDLQATRAQSEVIRVGDKVTVADCERPGRISEKGVLVSPSAQTVGVRATLPDAATCLKPNQYIEATISTAAAPGNSLTVPARALLQSGGRDYVFKRVAAGFQPVAVTVLSRDSTSVSIRDALPAGTEIAVEGIATLKGAWVGIGAADAKPATKAQAK